MDHTLITSLPYDIQKLILNYLNIRDIHNLKRVSRNYRKIVKENFYAKSHYDKHPELHYVEFKLNGSNYEQACIFGFLKMCGNCGGLNLSKCSTLKLFQMRLCWHCVRLPQYDTLPKTEIRKRFYLKETDVKRLPCYAKPNPHGGMHKMKIYSVKAAATLSLEIHGKEGLEAKRRKQQLAAGKKIFEQHNRLNSLILAMDDSSASLIKHRHIANEFIKHGRFIDEATNKTWLFEDIVAYYKYKYK